MLQFSANLSLLFTEYPLIERFALARQHGFDAIEIQFPYELPIEVIRKELNQYQLKLVLINVPAGDLMQGGYGITCVPGKEPAFRHAVLDALAYAAELDVPTVNLLAGRQPPDVDLLPCLQTLAANVRLACELFSLQGITPVIEAINGHDMPGFMIQTIDQAQELREAVQHDALGLQFDCYHVAMTGDHVLTTLQQNLPHIAHIQFADWPGRHEPGTGLMDFSGIFRFVETSDYAGYCGAEYRPSQLTSQTLGWMDAWKG